MIQLPKDPLSRFVSIYEALNEERGWWSHPSGLRFSALAALTCPGGAGEVARSIRRVAEEIRRKVRWFDELKSELRFLVSAMLVLQEDEVGAFLAEVKRVRELFRSIRLRRGGSYEIIAILLLRQRSGNRPIESQTIERFQAIYEEMKRHHWWLTGPEDFPMTALLAGSKENPRDLGDAIETIYQALHWQGFSSGDPLQTAANILYFAHIPAEVASKRFRDLYLGFKDGGVSIWKSDYDELAILSFLDHPAERIIDRVLAHRKEMERLRPKPGRTSTFNLAAGIAFLELAQLDRGMKTLLDAKNLIDLQSIIDAQRAAAATAASSSAS
ncbi:MAG: DUF4003 family protein [Planctomycetes bacterium]|nr:DUF4003 family protein [Planctomycetota bacterium]